ncbi:MAG TPA: L-histidine N(alpha)-methyltransferase [Thiotrichaceae bacterium]|jgi:L-histidine N-alpha-methyltransferase|nr:L-histidine N(alpha)-methyltransferase [Thiotrichaceae bacterium]HIM08385.1 L-histidine N(alpha)-methyltransferase [Gammaproteobacteria bacterium]
MQISTKFSEIEESGCIAIMPTRMIPNMHDDVRESLLNQPRSLSPKYFYDERGSELFDQICSTPEYYPTRTENALLEKYATDIINKTKPEQILELGSGYSVKTRRLFDACQNISHNCSYAPFDVCEEALVESAKKLAKEYQWLNLKPLLGDYNAGLGNLPAANGSHLYVFLGSTIGNFERHEATAFIQELYKVMRVGDHFLIGVDRVKENDVLHAAYNDAQGITAEFNLNVLHVLNRELHANFDIDEFTHSATFNTDEERIEMRLISNSAQKVQLNKLNESIHFEEGEHIVTEISQKYTHSGIEEMLTAANFSITYHYEDEDSYFSLVLASK